eukprot:CAMPEP_0175083472 /NCGR_PEP_ID=MMETSP0052_2-20121109/27407_1 /TAXON_ID=51329 ORGANISM="Polytomella parva, Strain SAG 63-3" /NCGR_SAMPLE_ID=MMETSP0052_2 /ASSEMBLY_ACC=CAM_ASM_000194 /LENGTH=634 /DNA_ID=CAMNT_0016354937 /DNA_START=76 /DNA_END=1977 /DNA_ORIENTATION=-
MSKSNVHIFESTKARDDKELNDVEEYEKSMKQRAEREETDQQLLCNQGGSVMGDDSDLDPLELVNAEDEAMVESFYLSGDVIDVLSDDFKEELGDELGQGSIDSPYEESSDDFNGEGISEGARLGQGGEEEERKVEKGKRKEDDKDRDRRRERWILGKERALVLQTLMEAITEADEAMEVREDEGKRRGYEEKERTEEEDDEQGKEYGEEEDRWKKGGDGYEPTQIDWKWRREGKEEATMRVGGRDDGGTESGAVIEKGERGEKGEKGEKEDHGDQGDQGDQGEDRSRESRPHPYLTLDSSARELGSSIFCRGLEMCCRRKRPNSNPWTGRKPKKTARDYRQEILYYMTVDDGTKRESGVAGQSSLASNRLVAHLADVAKHVMVTATAVAVVILMIRMVAAKAAKAAAERLVIDAALQIEQQKLREDLNVEFQSLLHEASNYPQPEDLNSPPPLIQIFCLPPHHDPRSPIPFSESPDSKLSEALTSLKVLAVAGQREEEGEEEEEEEEKEKEKEKKERREKKKNKAAFITKAARSAYLLDLSEDPFTSPQRLKVFRRTGKGDGAKKGAQGEELGMKGLVGEGEEKRGEEEKGEEEREGERGGKEEIREEDIRGEEIGGEEIGGEEKEEEEEEEK